MIDPSGLLMALAREADAMNTSAPWGPTLPDQECWGGQGPLLPRAWSSQPPSCPLDPGGHGLLCLEGRRAPGGHLEPVAPLYPILAFAPLSGGTGVFSARLRPFNLVQPPPGGSPHPANKACHQPPET